MHLVAAFRTYTWDDGVAELAERFFRATPGARQVVLADETRGPLDIPRYEVVPHTEDTAYLGLPRTPEGISSLWFNVDYGLYILRHALPGYDYYLTSESDLAVNLDLSFMISEVARRKIDFVAHDIKPSTADWHWHLNGSAVFERPWRSLLFFMLGSARAVDVLFEARRQHAEESRCGRLLNWPFCEPFVPSILKQTGMQVAEVSEFADTEHLCFRPRLLITDREANRPGSLAHSVLSKAPYVKGVIADYGVLDWFSSEGRLQLALAKVCPTDYALIMMSRLETERRYAALQTLTADMKARGMEIPSSADLALCKPALSSSYSEWSHFADEQQDACGANSRNMHHDYGFHTSVERDPWWMVDLLEIHLIRSLSIVNRLSYPDRFRFFKIESSVDTSSWIARYHKLDMTEVSNDPRIPHEIGFSDPFVARFVRVTLLGEGMLHLRNVSIFGSRVDA